MSQEEENYLKRELYNRMQEDEGFFDFLQAGSLDGLWYWDLEAPENEWMSPEFWRLFGFDPSQKSHKADEWQDLIFKEDLQQAQQNFALHLENPNHPYDQIVRYRHRLGHTIYVRCRGIAIRDKKTGKPIRMLGAHTDLTELMRAQESQNLLRYQIRALQMRVEAASMQAKDFEQRWKDAEKALEAIDLKSPNSDS